MTAVRDDTTDNYSVNCINVFNQRVMTYTHSQSQH